MPLFAKNKPTKRVEFEGGWVELQHISKGVKDEIASRLVGVYKGIDRTTLEKMKDDNNVPDSLVNELGVVFKAEHYKLAHAIKSWSDSDVPITEETVRELDEEIFNKINEEVNKMNGMDKTQEKN